ncbi:MAG: 3-hydroxyacyl-CoA dehydrogenase NAD-binding domain-containing protein, partial [Candidatus Palauibacterales bacterium]|nr:3-hydroxyacyl-CoA dehydrogenase NAD-binding domain-containing protein [Candidatus Palauibacterales bacterium]
MKAEDIRRAGVVGAGTMGNGIAHVLALAGIATHLVDVDDAALEQGIATIRKNLERQVARQAVAEAEAEAALARVESSTSLEDLAGS